MNICPQCGRKNRDAARFCNDCAAPLTTSGDPFIGATIDKKYKIEKKIAEGGMGSIYLAKDVQAKTKVALKILHPELARAKKFLNRFKNEAATSAGLIHENIVPVYESGPVPIKDTFFIAMEFIDGETLTDVIKKKAPLPVKYSFNVALGLAQGLSYAHKYGPGIIHRDMKPGNIIIEKSGRVVLTDFGIAKAVGKKGLTTTGSIIGTPDYMSLEQVKGQQLDGRSDIYSLGVVLYEMLTGVSPFRMDTGVSTITKILSEEAISIESLRSNLPDWVVWIVTKAMARKKSERFQSADEFAVAIERGLSGALKVEGVQKAAKGKKATKKEAGKPAGTATLSTVDKTRLIGGDIRSALTRVLVTSKDKFAQIPPAKEISFAQEQKLFLLSLLIIAIVSTLFAFGNSIIYGSFVSNKLGETWLIAMDVIGYLLIIPLWIYLIYISDPKKGAFLGGLFPFIVFVAINLFNPVFVEDFSFQPPKFLFSLFFATSIGTLFGFSISALSGVVKDSFSKFTAYPLLTIVFLGHLALIFLWQNYAFVFLFTLVFGQPGK